MANINLLPWREELRKKRQRDFAVMLLGGVIAAAGVMGGWHLYIEHLIDNQKARNAYLQREIAALNEKIKEIAEIEKTRNEIITRMDVIQRLQESRPAVVHMMDELVTTVPDGTFLVQFTQRGNGLTLVGRAQSNARVSSYMRNIEKNEWLANPDLRFVENKDTTGTGFSHFQLTAQNLSKRREKAK
jgi:type IV pilus assembly protein PilN